jgi:hypothetical protein
MPIRRRLLEAGLRASERTFFICEVALTTVFDSFALDAEFRFCSFLLYEWK